MCLHRISHSVKYKININFEINRCAALGDTYSEKRN